MLTFLLSFKNPQIENFCAPLTVQPSKVTHKQQSILSIFSFQFRNNTTWDCSC